MLCTNSLLNLKSNQLLYSKLCTVEPTIKVRAKEINWLILQRQVTILIISGKFSKYEDETSDHQLGINEKELNSMNKHIPGEKTHQWEMCLEADDILSCLLQPCEVTASRPRSVNTITQKVAGAGSLLCAVSLSMSLRQDYSSVSESYCQKSSSIVRSLQSPKNHNTFLVVGQRCQTFKLAKLVQVGSIQKRGSLRHNSWLILRMEAPYLEIFQQQKQL